MVANFILVAIGGALGAMARFALALATTKFFGEQFPWGTLLANGLGCLAMGFLLGFGIQKQYASAYLLFGVGVLGALTTYSTFSGETLTMCVDQRWGAAFGNVVANILVSLGGCAIGFAISRMFIGS